MAKKRLTIGSVVKSKESGQPDYIKISKDVTLKAGQYLNLESKASALASIEAAVAKGTLSEDNANAARERVEKTPDFVRFQITMTQEV